MKNGGKNKSVALIIFVQCMCVFVCVNIRTCFEVDF